MRRKVYQFTFNVAAASSVTLSQAVEGEGQLEMLRIRFYPGSQFATRVYPRVRDGRGVERSLVAYAPGATDYVAGDDETFELTPMERVSLAAGDEISVLLDNTNGTNPHWVNVHVEVLYHG